MIHIPVSNNFLFHLERLGLVQEYQDLSRTLDSLSENGGIQDDDLEEVETRFQELESTFQNLRQEDQKYVENWAGPDRKNIESYL